MSDGVYGGFLRLLYEIRAHASACYPREACGLLARMRDGAIAYCHCRNIAPEGAARDAFQIAPEDWVEVENRGEILGIVHSHPDASAHASWADRVMCHRTGLPWFVIGWPSGAWTVTWPEPVPLVDREFHHGIVDCYGLIQDYFAQRVNIELPDFERTDGWWERGEDLYRKGFAAAGFVDLGRPAGRVDGSTEVRLHDVLLMQVAARQENHAAVFVGPYHGMDSIIHHLYGRASGHDVWSRDWIERTTAVLRHRSLL